MVLNPLISKPYVPISPVLISSYALCSVMKQQILMHWKLKSFTPNHQFLIKQSLVKQVLQSFMQENIMSGPNCCGVDNGHGSTFLEP
jgi:hypothetical protein